MPVVDNIQPGLSSAQSYEPLEALSYHDFIESQGLDPGPYESGFLRAIGNPWTGAWSKKESEYQTYLQNLNKENEKRSLASARAYDLWLENTRYQRAAADLKAAGLNPWLLVNNGSFSPAGGSAYSNSSAKGVTYNAEDEKKSGILSLVTAILKAL